MALFELISAAKIGRIIWPGLQHDVMSLHARACPGSP